MSLFSRIIAAIAGGYLAANAISILLSLLLPGTQADNVLSGMLVSFLVYAALVIGVFSVRHLWQAWLLILIPAVSSSALIFLLLPGPRV